MTPDVVIVIGIGNSFRRDDGVGPVVAAAVEARTIPGVFVLTEVGDPLVVLDAWAGTRLAVLIDAAAATPSTPGRIHRCTTDHLVGSPAVSTHGIDLPTLLSLGETLGRMPHEVVVFAVEAKETGYGLGLTPDVQAAVPDVVAAVLAEVSVRSSHAR